VSRGRAWIDALAGLEATPLDGPASVVVAEAPLGNGRARYIAVVPNREARYPRARDGEVGIEEGYAIARAIEEAPADAAIVAIVDVPGQAFGLREEMEGLQCSLAAAVRAYVAARERVPVLALVVGRAISGAFLAHGLQAAWIGALRDPGVEVHVMSDRSVARVTRTTHDEVVRLASIVPATARDVETFARFGALDALFDVADADVPQPNDVAAIRNALARAAADPGLRGRRPVERLARAGTSRALSREVRERLEVAW
jgi:biotin-independent malonate decarboxylase gamma subunit